MAIATRRERHDDGGGSDHDLAGRLHHGSERRARPGLGEGGERLHYWVFGGPWSYEEPRGEATGTDREYLDRAMARAGAVVIGRGMYEAADAWGGQNPFGVPLFVVTHRPEEAPGDGFTFVDGLDEAISRARQEAGDKDVAIGGGADVIRQALGTDRWTSSRSRSRPSSSAAASACSMASNRR